MQKECLRHSSQRMRGYTFRVHGELTKSSTGVRPNKAMMAEIFTILLYSNSERLAYFNKNLELDF